MADLSTCAPLTRDSVEAARELIRAHVHETPVVRCGTLDRLASTPRTAVDLAASEQWASRAGRPARPVMRLWFKCENLQRVGAFKVRGAFHAVERLKADPTWVAAGGMDKGIVTHSAGNHAQALALAARESGIPAHVVMPDISAPPKIAATKGYGARVVFSGSTSTEREAVAAGVIAETGGRLVPPYDHPDIILGQGTVGLEIQEQVAKALASRGDSHEAARQGQPLPHAHAHAAAAARAGRGLDAIMAPCGGGGLLSGVALSCEGTGVRVFGAEPTLDGADDARRGYYAGARVKVVATRTIADGLRTPLGEHPWSVIHGRPGLVAGMFAVGEDDIRAAMRLVLERMKLLVEPSAAVPLAVALYNEDFRALVEKEAGPDGWDVAIVLSGGNVSLGALGELLGRE